MLAPSRATRVPKKGIPASWNIIGIDPYEIQKSERQDDVELWPAVTHIHACMYLILTPSPYSETVLLNFKSLDCYQNFVNGWVRQVLVKSVDDKRIMIGKVSSTSPIKDSMHV